MWYLRSNPCTTQEILPLTTAYDFSYNYTYSYRYINMILLIHTVSTYTHVETFFICVTLRCNYSSMKMVSLRFVFEKVICLCRQLCMLHNNYIDMTVYVNTFTVM